MLIGVGDRGVRSVVVGSLPSPIGSHHSHATVVGDLVFVSGLVASPAADGSRPGVSVGVDGRVTHDVERQLESIFAQLDTILEACGADRRSVVDVQVFLRDLAETFPIMNDCYGRYFDGHLPSRTTVEVVRFPSDVIVELKVIAARNSSVGDGTVS